MPTKKKRKTPDEFTLRCDQIEATAATQVRTELHKDVIDGYRDDILNGAIFPPIDVWCEKGAERWILSDGFHRLYAHIHAGKDEIEVVVHEGGMHEALLHALGANSTHGIRRSNSDKVNAVKLALKDPEISQKTQQEIADLVGVTRETVNRISRRSTLDEGVDATPGTPEDDKPENQRPTMPEPTQEEVERGELRDAMKAIRAFPYAGEDTLKLKLSASDVADLEYISTWAAAAVIVYSGRAEGDFDD